jgi:hypothetical protein
MTTEKTIQELAEEFADSKEIRGCAHWSGLYKGFIAGLTSKEDVNKVLYTTNVSLSNSEMKWREELEKQGAVMAEIIKAIEKLNQ